MSSNRPSGQNTPGRPSRGGRPGSGFPNNRGGRPAGNPTARAGGGPSTPRNPCRFFLQGNCREGTNCRFPHTTQPNPQPQAQNPAPSNFPGLTNDQFSTRGTNDTPGKTHHLLKLYVADTFKFAIPDQVYKFVELLCNASSQNPNWTAVDGQTHLRDLVKGNGILRLADALRFPAETNRPWSFQRGYIPIFTYLSSEWVTKSTMNSDVNALYGLVHNELGVIRKTLETHMKRLMEARSFKEGDKALSGKQVFKVLFVTMFEYLTRYKQATTTNPEVCDLVEQIAQWFDDWVTGLRSNLPFDDECAKYETAQRDHIINNLQHNKNQVLNVIRRTKVKVAQPEEHLTRRGPIVEGWAARLQANFKYDRPGEYRESGPRHDNDHQQIDKIRIAPTHAELLCEVEPFLPGNFLEAPHFHEAESVERLLDIQFRLLREELTAPIRAAVQEIVSDLREPRFSDTPLATLIRNGGGRYPNNSNAQDSVLFSVFTNIAFQPPSVSNRGTSVGITFDAPPGARGRNRKEYWERLTKKHLMQDTLVALIWKDVTGKLDIYIGKVASTPEELIASAEDNTDRVTLRVSFLDAAPELRILHIHQYRISDYGTVVLIEAPILFESIRPFLEALKRDPERLPFSQYLRLQPKDRLSQIAIAPPLYSLSPGFSFQLRELFDSSANIHSLSLTSNNPHSIANARAQLSVASRLDPSQVDAVIGSLTQEISLIQGPPGTGKSYTGLELIRVLLKNKISPILLVAFTNHALDHMLNGVLKNRITKKIIRVGSRFRMDTNLAPFALEDLVKTRPSGLEWEIRAAYRDMKGAEDDIAGLMEWISSRQIPSESVSEYLRVEYPLHYKEFSLDVPAWIVAVSRQYGLGNKDIRDADQGWKQATGKKAKKYSSIVDFWVAGQDLNRLSVQAARNTTNKKGKKAPIANLNKYDILEAETVENTVDSESQHESLDPEPVFDPRQELLQFLRRYGVAEIPSISSSSRPLESLQTDPKVWSMSLIERRTLYNVWITAAGDSLRRRQVREFEFYRREHTRARTEFEERNDQARANVLKSADIIGCTTTGEHCFSIDSGGKKKYLPGGLGAAKIISLLSSVGPRVMIVEEAGQVLESHILGSLVESVQQVIMIGDPLQLRPNINSYKLSMDNPNTGKIYRFDQSLMERLSTSGFPMSQLAVQRRMRPEISSLIRNTLYPELQDNELVFKYPHVRGMSKDVYFISHTNKESGGGDDSVSKHNQYEVDMIHDLVIHLLKQGCYNQEGDIVILAAYLGQIPKIRQKLDGVVVTLVDERDADLLAEYGIEDIEDKVQKAKASQRVIIRTLDNFQGEEGKIILLSLVRNSGTPFDGTAEGLKYGGRAPIGFLKSKNRTNVGLSRAKHGLYIFGNAPELARGSPMWANVLRELHTSEAGGIGKGFRMSCHNHPEYEQWIDRPGALNQVSPEGGCRRDCLAKLRCGHLCPSKCHANDPHHAATQCQEPCLRLCPVQHPCDRRCWECSETLGDCRFTVHDVPLPCGHVHPFALCHDAQLPETIVCEVQIENVPLPCGHTYPSAPCHLARLPKTIECNVEIYNLALPCGHVLPSALWHVLGYLAIRNVQQCFPVVTHALQICPVCAKDELLGGIVQRMQNTHLRDPVGEDDKDDQRAGLSPIQGPTPSRLWLSQPQPLPAEAAATFPNLRLMTITLACKHVFPVETLDRIAGLDGFYRKNRSGNWSELTTPNASGYSRSLPVCPTCGRSIDSLRYGRVYKSFHFTTSQDNIARGLSGTLNEVAQELTTIRKDLEVAVLKVVEDSLSTNASVAPTDDIRQKIATNIRRVVRKDEPTPAPLLHELRKFRAFSNYDDEAWKKAVSKAFGVYQQARQCTSHHDPTIQAYQRSLTRLFRGEMANVDLGRSRGTSEGLKQAALRVARSQIGHFPPRASLRYIVEAYWVMVEILVSLGRSTSKAVGRPRARTSHPEGFENWENLAEFFLLRAIADTETACRIAVISESWNKVVKCEILLLFLRLELATHHCRMGFSKVTPPMPRERAELVDKYSQGVEQLKVTQTRVLSEYLRRCSLNGQDSKLGQQWLQQNFIQPSTVLLESWEALKRTASGGFFHEGSVGERCPELLDAMFKEMGDHRSKVGRVSQCQNGHPNVFEGSDLRIEGKACMECSVLNEG